MRKPSHVAISPGVAALGLDDTLRGIIQRHARDSVGHPGYQSSCRGIDSRTGRHVVVYLATLGDPGLMLVCLEDEWSEITGLPAWASETPWPSDN